jgi:hypothetical protein
MIVQYKSIHKIKFPVYELSSGNWSRQDGLLFLESQIVDDKNQVGDTLGLRRLQTPHKNIKPLKAQIDTFRGIIKSAHKHFIDTNGTPFIYEKTEFCKLKYYRIKNIIQKDTCSLLKLEKVKNSFAIPRPPHIDMKYAGVLHYNGLPWVLYDYAETKLKDTRRKV